jgi:Phage major capsid protein E
MLNLLDNVIPEELFAYARAVPDPESFLLTREIVPVKNIQSNNATPAMARREVEHEFTEGVLPPLGDQWTVSELETILLAMEHGADDAQLIDAVYEDAEAHVLSIKARLELAAGDLITDGIVTIQENGLILEADFGMTVPFRPTAAVFWSDPAAPILDDLQAWTRKLVKDGTGRPGDAMASFEVMAQLAKNTQIRGAFYGENAAGGATRPTLTQGQVESVLAGVGVPRIREHDGTVIVDGQTVRTTPENRFFLLPAAKEPWAETQYGITAEALALSRNGNPRIEREDLPGIVVTKWESDRPVRAGTAGSAIALPVLHDPKGHISAQVLAAA